MRRISVSLFLVAACLGCDAAPPVPAPGGPSSPPLAGAASAASAGIARTETIDGYRITYTLQPGPTTLPEMQKTFQMQTIDLVTFDLDNTAQLLIVDVEAENGQPVPEDIVIVTSIHDPEGPPEEPYEWSRRPVNTSGRARALFVVPTNITKVEGKIRRGEASPPETSDDAE